MLYMFVYLSVLSPTFFLQSRVLDTPLAPTIGALTLCISDICAVIPRPGTTLYDFVQEVPLEDSPAIDAAPQAISMVASGIEGDGGGGWRGRYKEPEGHPPASAFFPAQTLHLPNVELFTSDPFQGSHLRFSTSPFDHRPFSRLFYPLNITRPAEPAIRPKVEPVFSNLTLAQGLWSDRDKYLALSSSGSLGRNASMFNWDVIVNGTANHTPAPPTDHIPSTLPPSKASHYPSQPQRRISPSPTTTAELPSLSLPRYLMSEEFPHLSDTHPTLLPLETTVDTRPAPQPKSLLADKALHLLNGTCVPVFVNEPPRPAVKVESPSFDTRPAPVFSRPYSSIHRARHGAPRNRVYTSPTSGMVVDWDTRSQDALLRSHIDDRASTADAKHVTLPVLPSIPTSPEPTTLFNNRRPAPTVAIQTSSTVNQKANRYNIAITLLVLGLVFSWVGEAGQSEGVHTKDFPGSFKTGEFEDPVKIRTSEVADVKVTLEEDVHVPMALHYTPLPARKKARLVTERRVQPARKCKTLPTYEAPSSTATSRGKGRKSTRA